MLMRPLAVTFGIALAFGGAFFQAHAQGVPDTDRDGLSDALEQRLLVQFLPAFRIGEHDCSKAPAAFEPNVVAPTAQADDGTIYGQVFPAMKSSHLHGPAVEVHYYHLWRSDCGRHGHPLDAEHVSVFLRADRPDPENAKWKAAYWFSAAHETTVCDVSQIARASTLHAEDHGAEVWISPDKHASYLNETLCRAGCGADRCERMKAMHAKGIVNLGEPGHAMNGTLFSASVLWPLQSKMMSSNFPESALARLEALPPNDIAWYNPGRHPAQGIIAISSHTQEHISHAGAQTNTAISTANDSTSAALATAGDNTGNALGKSYRSVKRSLGSSARHVGNALRVTPKHEDTKNPE